MLSVTMNVRQLIRPHPVGPCGPSRLQDHHLPFQRKCTPVSASLAFFRSKHSEKNILACILSGPITQVMLPKVASRHLSIHVHCLNKCHGGLLRTSAKAMGLFSEKTPRLPVNGLTIVPEDRVLLPSEY